GRLSRSCEYWADRISLTASSTRHLRRCLPSGGQRRLLLVNLIRLNTLVVHRAHIEHRRTLLVVAARPFPALAHASDDVAVQSAINGLRRRVRLVGARWLLGRLGAFALDIVKLHVTRAHGLVADAQCDGQR